MLETMMKNVQGLVLFDGPSEFDGEPIVCIATFKTNNPKTGNLIQTWILRKDINPIDAVEYGEDESICGNCIHRGTSCYVNIHFAPRNIWHAYKNGKYRKVRQSDLALFEGQNVRLGSYGDPAAIPYEFWMPIIKVAKQWTGYTHQWKTCDQRFKSILMASVETYKEYRQATRRGWRTFRVRLPESPLYQNEVGCPASKEMGRKTTCEKCNLCSGTYFGKRRIKNVSIVVHGGVFPPMIFRKTMLTIAK